VYSVLMNDEMDRLFRTMSFREAIYVYVSAKGLSSQYHALAEECAELIVAANHRRRGKGSREHLIEEMVDVLQMIDEFKLLEGITPQELEAMRQAKDAKFLQEIRNEIDERKIGTRAVVEWMDEAKQQSRYAPLFGVAEPQTD
jgi:hypothetical protein